MAEHQRMADYQEFIDMCQSSGVPSSAFVDNKKELTHVKYLTTQYSKYKYPMYRFVIGQDKNREPYILLADEIVNGKVGMHKIYVEIYKGKFVFAGKEFTKWNKLAEYLEITRYKPCPLMK